MNLLGACMLYSLCVRQFLVASMRFLDRLKISEQSVFRAASSSRGPFLFEPEGHELEQYLAFQKLLCDRLAKMQKSSRLKTAAQAIGLDLDRGFTQEDLKKAKFHRYLVVSLDQASCDFVLWSPSSLLALIASCALVAFISGWKKLSLVWLLPCLLLAFFVLFALAHLWKNALWAAIVKDTCEASMPWLSAKRWITAVQTVLFMLCHSFAQLVFLRSMWTECAWLAFGVLGGFVLMFSLTLVCIGDLMMRMVCILSLPPHASTELLAEYFEKIPAVAIEGKAEY